MSLPDVIIIGDFPFPYGAASANNLRAHCAALQTAGYTVGVLPKMREWDEGSPAKKLFRGVCYWEMSKPRHSSQFWRVSQEILHLSDPRLEFFGHGDLSEVKVVFAYTGIAGASIFLYRLRDLCKKRGIKLYCYVVEWFDWRHIKGTLAWLNIMDAELLRRVMMRSADGVITISDFLHNHYTLKGLKSYCIPPLLDLTDPIWQDDISTPCIEKRQSIRLLFSGNYIRDRHDVILESVLKMRRSGSDITMEYLGATREQIQQMSGVSAKLINELGTGVRFHGRLDDKSVASITRSASFGIMLRDNQRWSQACFPSKVPEFAALGVPMICNVSSDLARYLRDGENSLVCKAVTVDAFCEVLQRALEMTGNQFRSMRIAARETAELFDSRKFAETYRTLVG